MGANWPRDSVIECPSGVRIPLKAFVDARRSRIHDMVHQTQRRGGRFSDGFAFALAKPIWDPRRRLDLSYPENFVLGVSAPVTHEGFANGALAVGVLRAAVRFHQETPTVEVRTTLDARVNGTGQFVDVIEHGASEGGYPFGDYPFGGGVSMRFGPVILAAGVIGFAETLNDAAAMALLRELGAFMVQSGELFPTN